MTIPRGDNHFPAQLSILPTIFWPILMSSVSTSPAWPGELYDLLREHDITQFAYVPDAGDVDTDDIKIARDRHRLLSGLFHSEAQADRRAGIGHLAADVLPGT